MPPDNPKSSVYQGRIAKSPAFLWDKAKVQRLKGSWILPPRLGLPSVGNWWAGRCHDLDIYWHILTVPRARKKWGPKRQMYWTFGVNHIFREYFEDASVVWASVTIPNASPFECSSPPNMIWTLGNICSPWVWFLFLEIRGWHVGERRTWRLIPGSKGVQISCKRIKVVSRGNVQSQLRSNLRLQST